MINPSRAHWRKSSRSGIVQESCVEVASLSDAIGVRDSKDRDGGHLALTRQQWRSLVSQIRHGGLDL